MMGGQRQSRAFSDAALSPMQREVIRRLARGEKTDSIARELRMSKNTLYAHRYRAQQKYGATGLMDLLQKLGWLTIPD